MNIFFFFLVSIENKWRNSTDVKKYLTIQKICTYYCFLQNPKQTLMMHGDVDKTDRKDVDFLIRVIIIIIMWDIRVTIVSQLCQGLWGLYPTPTTKSYIEKTRIKPSILTSSEICVAWHCNYSAKSFFLCSRLYERMGNTQNAISPVAKKNKCGRKLENNKKRWEDILQKIIVLKSQQQWKVAIVKHYKGEEKKSCLVSDSGKNCRI